MLRKGTLALILSSVIRAVTQMRNKRERKTSSAVLHFSIAACHYLSTSYFTYCHLLLSPLLRPTALPMDVITSIQRCSAKLPAPSTHSSLSLVKSGHPFVIEGTNKLCLLTQLRQEESLEWNQAESIRTETRGLWLSKISKINGYECLSLCVFTAVISALCCE